LSSEIKHFHINTFQKSGECLCTVYLLLDDGKIITWDASAVVTQTTFLFFFLSDSILLLSTGLYQSLRQSFPLVISLSIWIHTFSHNSPPLSDFLFPSPIPPLLLTCCHMAVPARWIHHPLSELLLPAFCTFPLSSIPSHYIYSSPIVLSAAMLPPASSLSPLFFLFIPCLHFTTLPVTQKMCNFEYKKDAAKDRKPTLLFFLLLSTFFSCPYFLSPPNQIYSQPAVLFSYSAFYLLHKGCSGR